jgi:hypothetical protein
MRDLFIGFLLALPSVAAAAEPSIAGVWQGTLGKNNIVLCVNNDQDVGSYYYVKHRMPIPLGRDGQGWKEAGDTGKWELVASASAAMEGTWRSPKGGAPLPIKLILVSRSSDPEPCASDAYNAALETMPQLQIGATQKFNNYAYRTLRIADVETLELLSPAPAQQAVNRQLRDMLPKSINDVSEYFAKRREFLGRMGLAAEDETSATPEFWNSEFVTIRFNRWAAGFGRRGAGSEYLTWDLKSGSSVNLWEWFIATPRVDDGDKRHRLFKTAPPAPECKDGYYGKGDFQLTLEADAVRFWEEAYGDGCEQDFRIPYNKLAPVLSAQGKLGVARLMGKRPQ